MDEIRGMKVEKQGNNLVFTRSFKAPRELVYKAWTNAEYLAQWWGPHGYINPECSVDLKVGGEYRVTMQGPDGVLLPVKGVFLEIVENEKLVMTDEMTDMPQEFTRMVQESRGVPVDSEIMQMKLTVLFEDEEGGTKMTLISHFETEQDREAILKLGATEGWAMSLEKMDTLLTCMLHKKH